jgi:inorganic pyrophosphatase
MIIEKISSGKDVPNEINVIIEIPMNHDPIKYEIDKDSGAVFVDRFMQTAMHYPCNYGFVPHTLSEDGDPIDVLLLSHYPVIPSAVVCSRPIGVLLMEDESGKDEKIIAVPVSKSDITFDNIRSIEDIDVTLKARIKHFFEHYKDLDKNKWVKVQDWEGVDSAKKLIEESVQRHLVFLISNS